jgi:ankyrin repeat protein
MPCATLHGHIEVVRWLLQAGADITYSGSRYGTPLQGASTAGKLDMVRLLISEGAAINIPRISFRTALYAASVYGHQEVVELRFQSGARVKGNGPDPFHYNSPSRTAIATGHNATTQVLFRHHCRSDRPFVWFFNLVLDPVQCYKNEVQLYDWTSSGRRLIKSRLSKHQKIS